MENEVMIKSLEKCIKQGEINLGNTNYGLSFLALSERIRFVKSSKAKKNKSKNQKSKKHSHKKLNFPEKMEFDNKNGKHDVVVKNGFLSGEIKNNTDYEKKSIEF
jgi:hypothetical protein